MNLCRTCKYWSVRSHMIGAGNCVNLRLHCEVIVGQGKGIFITPQDFGCTLHEEGHCSANLLPAEEHEAVLSEFIHHYVPLPLKQ